MGPTWPVYFGPLTWTTKPSGSLNLKLSSSPRAPGVSFRPAALDLGAHRRRVPAFQAEIEMIQRRHIGLLLDAEEALAHRQDVDGLGLLRQLHAEELLVEAARSSAGREPAR